MKDIPGYEGLYAVTEDGKVWSYGRNKFLKQRISIKRGGKYNKIYTHITYALCKNGKQKSYTAARLVAQAYIPNPQNLPEVDHIDRDPANNNVTNLRWVTRIENNNNKDFSNLRKPVAQIDMKTKEVVNTFSSGREAARILFNDASKKISINMCASHYKRKSAYGYYWEYI